jgi:hypothetical protein
MKNGFLRFISVAALWLLATQASRAARTRTAIHNNLEVCDLSFRFSKMMQGVGPQRQCKKRKGYAYAYHQRYQRRV